MDDNDDEFAFDGMAVGSPSKSVVASSQSSSSPSILSSRHQGGRTKAGRRIERGLSAFPIIPVSTNNDNEKTVRFSSFLPDQDYSWPSSASSSPSKASSRSRSAYGKRRRQRSYTSYTSSTSSPTRRQRRDANDEDSFLSLDSAEKRSSSLESQASSTSSASDTRRRRRLLLEQDDDDTTPAKPVTGAGTDVLAVQDAGSYRMLHDDCIYQCSSIASSCKKTQPCIDLANMLAVPKTRTVLWADATATSAILQVLGQIPSSICPPLHSSQLNLGLGAGAGSENDVFSQHCYQGDDAGSVASCSTSGSVGPTQLGGGIRSKAGSKRAAVWDPAALSAVAAVAHFASVDCTLNEHAATTPKAARKLRKQLLQHSEAMTGMSLLILRDAVVRNQLVTRDAIVTNDKQGGEDDVSLAASSVDNVEELQCCGAASSQASLASSVSTISNSGDPTAAGRRKRKRRRIVLPGSSINDALEPIPETAASNKKQDAEEEDFAFSFPSDASTSTRSPVARRPRASLKGDDENGSVTANRTTERLRQLSSKLVVGNDDLMSKQNHSCLLQSDKDTVSSSMLALTSLNRIIQGREGEEESCIDNEEGEADVDGDRHVISRASSSEDHNGNSQQQAREEADLASNPLMVTNALLNQSGCLPILALAMTETLAAVRSNIVDQKDECTACHSHLMQRMTVLASIVDGACCLCGENRQELCENGFLVASILQLLKLVTCRQVPHCHWLLDVALISIRTLTSLTHENATTGEQLMRKYLFQQNMGDVDGTKEETIVGAEVLASLLFRIVSANSEADGQSQLSYDMAIFCLNTLTNSIDAQGMRRALLSYQVRLNEEKEQSFVSWLTHWIVSETASFRDGVMHGTFGKKVDSQPQDASSGYLDKAAEEHLVTAGNGFILLACFLTHDGDDCSAAAARSIILKHMPRNEDQSPTGFTLIKNTLKAFCNFYHYSVGDLSVAIVAPVKKIVMDLERMERKDDSKY